MDKTTLKALKLQEKAVRSLYKRACKDPREKLHYSYIQNGLQYVCDGFSLFGITNYIDLPVTKDYIDVDYIFSSCCKGQSKQIDLPSADYLKLEIKRAREKKLPAVYHFGEGFPYVNAKFLLCCIEAFPEAYASVYLLPRKSNYERSAISFLSSFNDFGILLPIRATDLVKLKNDNYVFTGGTK